MPTTYVVQDMLLSLGPTSPANPSGLGSIVVQLKPDVDITTQIVFYPCSSSGATGSSTTTTLMGPGPLEFDAGGEVADAELPPFATTLSPSGSGETSVVF